jgi:hypothetical protein
MSARFIETVELVHEVFSTSQVLTALGYATSSREYTKETVALDAGCRFTLEPVNSRKLVIHFYFRRDDQHYLTVEIFNTVNVSSFLLSEWMQLQGESLDPYPFTLRGYSGSLRERLTGFLSLLDSKLSAEEMFNVLRGHSWLNIPFDWGNIR